jgi:divalent metal cation (Fe/Co/Zn/Cd) transporter
LPNADVMIHVEPAPIDEQDVVTTVRLLAGRRGLAAHGVRIYVDKAGQRSLELHLEVDASLRLEEAHHQVSLFERELKEALPAVSQIVSHIEPAGDAAVTLSVETVRKTQIERAIAAYIKEKGLSVRPHDVKVQLVAGELAVSFHCALDADTAITDAHEFTEQLEKRLRQKVANLGRVVIHVEPPEEA